MLGYRTENVWQDALVLAKSERLELRDNNFYGQFLWTL